jgi:two-component system sensor histidine kinase TctE
VLALGVGLAILALGPGPAAARVETWPAPAGQGGPVLRLVTDGEVATLRRLVRLFQLAHPGAGVEIAHLSAGLVEQAVRTARASGEGPDVAMSAAVDRQVRLVNDGLALPHRSAQTARLPDWATWRGELFGATYEPVVFAYDPRAFPGEEPPRTRLRLAQLLETEPERFRGRVITYHVGLNGMGYVFATFDSLTTPVFWRLARAMGDVEVRLASEPVEIMSALERGEASLAYNVAASASVVEGAIARGLILVEPQDYRLVVLRTLLVPRTAREPGLARAFVDLALSEAGQAAIGSTALLGPRRAAAEGEARAPAHVVPLAPASLIFLDERKRNRFLDTWLQLMVKP